MLLAALMVVPVHKASTSYRSDLHTYVYVSLTRRRQNHVSGFGLQTEDDRRGKLRQENSLDVLRRRLRRKEEAMA